jgi:ABC-type uncharacterized transport system substrate-binding protein
LLRVSTGREATSQVSGFNAAQLNEKRMQLLHELVPKAATIAALVAQDNPAAECFVRQAQEAARSLGLQVRS